MCIRDRIGVIGEHMTRYVPADLDFQNERTRYGTWAFLSQQLTPTDSVHFGWAHAFQTPGDPCQHNDCTVPVPDSCLLYTSPKSLLKKIICDPRRVD